MNRLAFLRHADRRRVSSCLAIVQRHAYVDVCGLSTRNTVSDAAILREAPLSFESCHWCRVAGTLTSGPCARSIHVPPSDPRVWEAGRGQQTSEGRWSGQKERWRTAGPSRSFIKFHERCQNILIQITILISEIRKTYTERHVRQFRFGKLHCCHSAGCFPPPSRHLLAIGNSPLSVVANGALGLLHIACFAGSHTSSEGETYA